MTNFYFYDINEINIKGVWSSGMTEVSKTFSGSSILSTPVKENSEKRVKQAFFGLFVLQENGQVIKEVIRTNVCN